ncbi:hypothetical protein IV102_29635 [bacterium]|nr:hypothetical protein [bacterium]
MSLASTLLATVGTSMLRNRHDDIDARQLSRALDSLPWSDPACGAELNSLHLLTQGHVDPDCFIHYFLSDTPQAQLVGLALRDRIGKQRVSLHTVKSLDPSNPQLFARRGLANLAAGVGRVLRGLNHSYCAFDATAGFKAQVGVVVALGQALQIPVYYRHETFDQVISLPPMPISLDARLWCQNASLFFDLADDLNTLPSLPQDPRLLSLLEWQVQEDAYLVGLNATGAIFHEALLQQWPDVAILQLPRPASHKEPPLLTEHNWPDRTRLLRTMQKITDHIPYVNRCITRYLNPDLPRRNLFLLKGTQILAQVSDGTHTAHFEVRTTARSPAQRAACLADLVHRLHTGKDGQWLW